MKYKRIITLVNICIFAAVNSVPLPVPSLTWTNEDDEGANNTTHTTTHPPHLLSSKKKTLATNHGHSDKHSLVIPGHIDILGGHHQQSQSHLLGNTHSTQIQSHNDTRRDVEHSGGTLSSHKSSTQKPELQSEEVESSAKLSKISKIKTRPTTTTPPPSEDPPTTEPPEDPPPPPPPPPTKPPRKKSTTPKPVDEDKDDNDDGGEEEDGDEEDPIALLMKLLEEKGPMGMIAGGFVLVLGATVGYSTKIINMLKNPGQVSNVSDTFKKMGGGKGKGGVPMKLLSSLTKKGGKKEIFNTLKSLLDDPTKEKKSTTGQQKDNSKFNLENENEEKQKKELTLKSGKRNVSKYDDSEDEDVRKKSKRDKYDESEDERRDKKKNKSVNDDYSEEENSRRKSKQKKLKDSEEEDIRKKSTQKKLKYSEDEKSKETSKRPKSDISDMENKKGRRISRKQEIENSDLSDETPPPASKSRGSKSKIQRKIQKSDSSEETPTPPPPPKSRKKKSKIEMSDSDDNGIELKVLKKQTKQRSRREMQNYDEDLGGSFRSKVSPARTSLTSGQIFDNGGYLQQQGRNPTLIPGYAQNVSRMASPVPTFITQYPGIQAKSQNPVLPSQYHQIIPEIHTPTNIGFGHPVPIPSQLPSMFAQYPPLIYQTEQKQTSELPQALAKALQAQTLTNVIQNPLFHTTSIQDNPLAQNTRIPEVPLLVDIEDNTKSPPSLPQLITTERDAIGDLDGVLESLEGGVYNYRKLNPFGPSSSTRSSISGQGLNNKYLLQPPPPTRQMSPLPKVIVTEPHSNRSMEYSNGKRNAATGKFGGDEVEFYENVQIIPSNAYRQKPMQEPYLNGYDDNQYGKYNINL